MKTITWFYIYLALTFILAFLTSSAYAYDRHTNCTTHEMPWVTESQCTENAIEEQKLVDAEWAQTKKALAKSQQEYEHRQAMKRAQDFKESGVAK